ncbi:MAG: hypothetical protein JW820_09655 [Spirochaetales bacterium]|nr:hypothetical protein [Spirochaetales bacterium]
MRTTRLKTLGAAGALALGLAACSFPPYDEGLSLGMLAARKMDPVAAVGPLNLWYGDFQELETRFLLSQSNLIAGLPIEGYVVALGTYNARMFAVERDVLDTNHWIGEERWMSVDNSDPNEFSISVDVAKDPTFGGGDLIAFAFQDAGKYLVTRDLLQPLEGEGDFPLDFLIETEFGVSGAEIVGATLVPASDTNYDEVLVLWFDPRAGFEQFHEARFQTIHPPAPPGLALGTPADVRGGFGFTGLPSGIEGGFYGHHAASGRSYLSVYIDGQDTYRTFRWDDSLAVTELTEMERRVDRVLSNGMLFSYGETMGYVFDASGNQVNRFPLGELYLSCEITVGMTPRLFFTLPTWGRGGGGEDFLHILVYSIPTSEIDEL